jgi:ABC-type uncharacterized transport system substrate-binding protein
MRRREFITLIGGAAAWPLVARAQQPTAKMPRVGVLWHAANAAAEGPYFRALMEGFRKLGYVEGRNITIENRFPNEVPAQFKSMAADLVSLQVDVLIGVGAIASQYVKNASATIPIVFIYAPDPVGSKLVDSLAHPGRNATGLTIMAPELTGKRLQFLKETIPGLTRVALLTNPNAQISNLYITEAQAAATNLGLDLQKFEARSLEELRPTFESMTRAGSQALSINSEGLFYVGRETIAKLAIEHRLPTCVWSRETLEAGALMSYGPDQIAICRRAAVYVDKILKGAKPAELPVEQPTKFQFLINLKTAKALGLTVPPTLLTSADEVIE